MTKATKLANVKAMLEIDGTEQDSILNMYLNIASNAITRKVYPFEDIEGYEMPNKYDYLQCEIAVYLYNKRGAEGETSHNENGINRSYESSGIPKSLLAQVVPFVGVI